MVNAKNSAPRTQTVSLVSIDSYSPQEKLNAAVLRAINLCGASGLVRPGSNVLVKPNVLIPVAPSRSVTTHPAVLHAVCEWLHGLDCSITVGDSTSHIGGGIAALEAAGLAAVARGFGAKVVDFDRAGIVYVKTPNASGTLPRVGLSKLVKSADCVISLPKLKTHVLTTLTCGVKNCYGMVPGGQKQSIHALNPNATQFSNVLVDIFEAASPHLTIVDGITCMDGLGPSNGRIRNFGMIAAGRNAAAVDFVMAGITGIGLHNVQTVQECLRRKLVIPDSVNVVGNPPSPVEKFRKPIPINRLLSVFKGSPPRFIEGVIVPRPFITASKCRKCGACVRICPVKVLEMRKNPASVPVFARRNDCIHCYCCYEACQFGAVRLSRFHRA